MQGIETESIDLSRRQAVRVLHRTTSLCRECHNGLDAEVVALEDGEVWMVKRCERHGEQSVRLSTNARWYESMRAFRPLASAPAPKTDVSRGCPFDCGPCASHEQRTRLPIVNINSSCDLDCPICFVHNKNDDAFHMSIAEFRDILRHLGDAHGRMPDLINLTGGEPTLHPDFLECLEASAEAGIDRVSICTNGIRLAGDEDLVARLASTGARVALAFDSFDAEADYAMQGARLLDVKLRCLDLLERYEIGTTLIPVVTRGYNDHELGRLIDLAVSRPNVRHIEFHTITYTGQGGVSFDRSGRVSIYEVLESIEDQTGGRLTVDDFVPSPCAHALCYQIAYLLMDPAGGRPLPFTRFLDRATVAECLAERLYLEPGPRLERALREAIDRLWSRGAPDDERALALLKATLAELFPRGRQLSRQEALRRSERAVKAVYVHSHMDEDTFDTERAALCCDADCFADGAVIPVCNYNVLYRDKQPEFKMPPAVWGERRGGDYFGRAREAAPTEDVR